MKKQFFIILLLFILVLPLAAQDSSEASNEKKFDESTILINSTTQDADAGSEKNNEGNFLTVWDFVKVIILLVAVILVVYGFFHFLKKAGGNKFQNNNLIKLVSSQSLTQNGSVHLIELGAKYYLVGCAEGGVSLIADIDDKESIDEIIINNPVSSEERKSFLDFFKTNAGLKNKKEADISEKIKNNNKIMRDSVERLKKM
ncbi:MAG: flagellar biosynthetic protein FliO [Spirochaetales bacterium]|nr:flagellar biosynthetic protein FliO [Spirochaetales bacterium]